VITIPEGLPGNDTVVYPEASPPVPVPPGESADTDSGPADASNDDLSDRDAGVAATDGPDGQSDAVGEAASD
jgi:hypothetical protein